MVVKSKNGNEIPSDMEHVKAGKIEQVENRMHIIYMIDFTCKQCGGKDGIHDIIDFNKMQSYIRCIKCGTTNSVIVDYENRFKLDLSLKHEAMGVD